MTIDAQVYAFYVPGGTKVELKEPGIPAGSIVSIEDCEIVVAARSEVEARVFAETLLKDKGLAYSWIPKALMKVRPLEVPGLLWGSV